MKKLLFIILFCSTYLNAQDAFYRSLISAERLSANRSYTVKVSTDSTPPALGFIKLWARDTNSVFLIFPTGYRVNLKLVAAGIGTVTNVSGSSPDVTVTSGTSTPNISINSGVAANRLMRFDASGRYPAADGSLITGLNTNIVTEGSNLYYTTARAQTDARSALAGSGIVTYNSTTGTFSVNTQAITNAYIADQTITNSKIAPGNVVKSLNGLTDNVKIVGENGASTRVSNDTVYVTGLGGGGGSGDTIKAIQSSGSITVTNPNGPTVTIDVATNGIDSNKIKPANVTGTDIKAGEILTSHFNASAKAPSATVADSATPKGSALGGDITGNYPNNLSVGTGKITSAKILDGTIVRGDVSSTFQAPFSDTSMGLSTTYWLFASTTILANTDSIHIVDSRVTLNSKAQSLCVRGRYVTGYLGTVPVFIPYTGSYTIWFPREMPGVDINLDYILKF